MPLLDHFKPPLSLQRPWEGIHGAWAAAIATQLNHDLLPPDYFAMPLITIGGQVEVDVGTFREPATEQSSNGSVATAVWAPPKATLSTPVNFSAQDTYEVQVLQELGGPKLRAAIELISPSNKDRPSNRHGFAIKCAAYLHNGISVVLVDVVSERLANFHAELTELLQLPSDFNWNSPTNLYAVAYRLYREVEKLKMDAWPEALKVGDALPTMPLWLDEELCLPLDLEQSYITTCESLRITV